MHIFIIIVLINLLEARLLQNKSQFLAPTLTQQKNHVIFRQTVNTKIEIYLKWISLEHHVIYVHKIYCT